MNSDLGTVGYSPDRLGCRARSFDHAIEDLIEAADMLSEATGASPQAVLTGLAELLRKQAKGQLLRREFDVRFGSARL